MTPISPDPRQATSSTKPPRNPSTPPPVPAKPHQTPRTISTYSSYSDAESLLATEFQPIQATHGRRASASSHNLLSYPSVVSLVPSARDSAVVMAGTRNSSGTLPVGASLLPTHSPERPEIRPSVVIPIILQMRWQGYHGPNHLLALGLPARSHQVVQMAMPLCRHRVHRPT